MFMSAIAGTAIASVLAHARNRLSAWALCALAVLAVCLPPSANAQSGAAPQSATIQWHATDKPMAVEDMTAFSVWLLGTVIREPAPTIPPEVGQIIRLNASIPAFRAAILTPQGQPRVMTMVASSPMRNAVRIHGLRITWETKTLRAGSVETPRLATPYTVPAGRVITVRYDLSTGLVTLSHQ